MMNLIRKEDQLWIYKPKFYYSNDDYISYSKGNNFIILAREGYKGTISMTNSLDQLIFFLTGTPIIDLYSNKTMTASASMTFEIDGKPQWWRKASTSQE